MHILYYIDHQFYNQYVLYELIQITRNTFQREYTLKTSVLFLREKHNSVSYE